MSHIPRFGASWALFPEHYHKSIRAKAQRKSEPLKELENALKNCFENIQGFFTQFFKPMTETNTTRTIELKKITSSNDFNRAVSIQDFRPMTQYKPLNT